MNAHDPLNARPSLLHHGRIAQFALTELEIHALHEIAAVGPHGRVYDLVRDYNDDDQALYIREPDGHLGRVVKPVLDAADRITREATAE